MTEASVRAVLVVDDDELTLRAFRREPTKNWNVTTAASAPQALEAAKQQRFEVAIVDMHLGATSGVPLIRDLKARQPHLRIALVSGYLTTNSTVTAVHAGADLVLDKPITLREILRKVDAGQPVDVDLTETPSLEDAMNAHIARVSGDCDGNITEAARRLRVARSSLQRRRRRRNRKK